MNPPAVQKALLSSALFVWAALLSTPAGAQTINVTSGFLDMNTYSGPVLLGGVEGFTFQSHVDINGGNYGPFDCNASPHRCVPGGTVNLNSFWSGSGAPGTATLDGVTYRNVGGQLSYSSANLDFRGSAVLPPMAPSATISAPFTFSGTFRHPVGRNQGTVLRNLAGSGTAILSLRSQAPFYPDSWYVSRVQYVFGSTLPFPWMSADVGHVGLEGSASYSSSSGSFSVAGAGADIAGTADAFRFTSRLLPGDGEIIARVTAEQDTHPFAKAGVMLRQSYDLSSPHVILDIKPDGGIEFMTRATAGGGTTFIAGAAASFPVWLKLTRIGSTVTGSVSGEGSSWTVVGSTTLNGWAGPSRPIVGLAVTSHDTTVLNQSVFDHVSGTPGPVGTPGPGVPTALTAHPAGHGRVQLAWSAAAGAATYNVKRRSAPRGEALVTTGVLSNHYIDTAVTIGHTYYYVVSAVNTIGESANSNEVSVTVSNVTVSGDVDGDGKADLTVFRPSNGVWYTMNSGAGTQSAFAWGNSADKPVAGDYDGDGRTDIAVFRPSTGVWYVVPSTSGVAYGFQWGNGGDVPVPGDYDGDRKTDIAVFRPSNGTWYIVPSTTGVSYGFEWGNGADITVQADYDGDGKTDIALFRPSNGTWYVVNSSTGAPTALAWGNGADVTVPGDYDGDGKTDIAVFRPSNGTWYVVRSTDGVPFGFAWGNSADTPVPGDYDGDGKTDMAVFRPSNANWYIVRSTTGVPYAFQWGNGGDIAILSRP